MKTSAWAAFWFVSLVWGSSFLLIRVGVEHLAPTQLVFIRTGVAAIGLNIVLHLRGKRWPRDLKMLRSLFIIGLFNTAVPFTFISIGEQTVPSGLASVIQSTVPFFSLVIAHFAFVDERITSRKVLGIAFGFLGILVLSSRSLSGGRAIEDLFLGQLAIMAASLCYASATVYSRKMLQGTIEPIVLATAALTFSALISAVFVVIEPLVGGRAWVPLESVDTDIVLAVLSLGFFNTFLAYLFFYFIVRELGAFRATMVTYVVPVVGLILGTLILNETLDALLVIGALLIFTGIGVINIRLKQLRTTRFSAQQAAPNVEG